MVDFTEAIKKCVRACLPGVPAKRRPDQSAAAPAVRREEITATILVCTPDIDSAIARTCLDSVRKYTTGVPYELLVFENGRFGKFQHPLEVNRALDIAQGDVLVTLDDDVELTEGWLEAMIAAAEPDVGIVGCVNINGREGSRGTVRSVAVVIDYDGAPRHYTQPIASPISVPCSCSCCWLINDKSLRFDLRYQKYFQEGDICLQSWERGKKVVVVPHTIFHLGQGQMKALGLNTEEIRAVSAADRQRFKEHWIDNGKMRAIYNKIRPVVGMPLPK